VDRPTVTVEHHKVSSATAAGSRPWRRQLKQGDGAWLEPGWTTDFGP
jgi:hypothetical protein